MRPGATRVLQRGLALIMISAIPPANLSPIRPKSSRGQRNANNVGLEERVTIYYKLQHHFLTTHALLFDLVRQPGLVIKRLYNYAACWFAAIGAFSCIVGLFYLVCQSNLTSEFFSLTFSRFSI